MERQIHLVWYLYLGESSGWDCVFFRQLSKVAIQVADNVISQVHLVVKGDKNKRIYVINAIQKLVGPNIANIVEFSIDERDKSEYVAINYIWQLSQIMPKIELIYIHLKGISYQQSSSDKYLCSLEWGDYLEWAILERAKINSEILRNGNFHVLGCNFIKYQYQNETRLGFSGNFWTAKAMHIKNLEKPKSANDAMEEYGIDKKNSWRLYYEYWVTSTKGAYANAYKSHSVNYPNFHYHNRIKRRDYEKTSRI